MCGSGREAVSGRGRDDTCTECWAGWTAAGPTLPQTEFAFSGAFTREYGVSTRPLPPEPGCLDPARRLRPGINAPAPRLFAVELCNERSLPKAGRFVTGV